MQKPRLLVFASGSPTGGGSGFRELVKNSRTGVLAADIIGVISNHTHGGVAELARQWDIPFRSMPKPYDAESYRALVAEFKAAFVSLSGWLKIVAGLDPATTINIHPGPLPLFGGKGLYGHHVHEAVMAAYHQRTLTASAVTMHFVTPEYDRGPIFFQYPVYIQPDDTADTLAAQVNKIEHGWQSYITNLVITGQIRLENDRVIAPAWYPFVPKKQAT
ncbi:MAG: formyltransferase family protein [Patescibacteria group bacterium]